METSECETEYTEECSDECQETCEDDMIEVCAEVRDNNDDGCVTLFRDDCESHWVGEGENRVSTGTVHKLTKEDKNFQKLKNFIYEQDFKHI